MIVLASASPRRHELLSMLGIPHIVDPAHVDESVKPGEAPEALARRLAREKAITVARRHSDVPALGADTIVVLGDRVLNKPESPAEAVAMLTDLAGREHTVITAVALAMAHTLWEGCDVTRVRFRPLSAEMISAYVATGEPLDKAGAYGVQGYGAALVERIEGDFFGVMGLPVRVVLQLLEDAGMPYRFTR